LIPSFFFADLRNKQNNERRRGREKGGDREGQRELEDREG
jgi:hypothetical protein